MSAGELLWDRKTFDWVGHVHMEIGANRTVKCESWVVNIYFSMESNVYDSKGGESEEMQSVYGVGWQL